MAGGSASGSGTTFPMNGKPVCVVCVCVCVCWGGGGGGGGGGFPLNLYAYKDLCIQWQEEMPVQVEVELLYQ